MYYLKKITLPFTAPFVIATWILAYLLLFVFKVPLLSTSVSTSNTLDILASFSNSFGQVMFQENMITGLFFLLAILVNNRLMAIYAVYAAILGSLTGWLFLESVSEVNAGLMGYNAILCAIALTGKSWKDFLWISMAIILSTLLNIGMGLTGLITLTAPFVLAAWGILMLKKVKNSL
jgi:urea transporter